MKSYEELLVKLLEKAETFSDKLTDLNNQNNDLTNEIETLKNQIEKLNENNKNVPSKKM